MSFSVLITGSSGYIGSHLVKYFKKNGASVFGIDLHFPPKNLQRYFDNHIVEDISSPKHVAEFLKKHKADIVIHCAGKCLVAESVEKPEMYRDYNVTRAHVFLQTCLDAGISRFLFSSTAATYGEPLQVPIPETHPQQPINPYGQTKLDFEKILLLEQQKNRLCVGITRYFNVAGADPDIEIGEHHEPETHLIPNILTALMSGQPVPIYGENYPTKDGTCVRDYIHVWDLANLHWLLARKMIETNQGGIYNLGTTTGFSILEVVQAAEKVLNKSAQKKILPKRSGDPSTLIADASKAKTELGWRISYSNLSDIIDTAYRWHQKKSDL